MTQPRGFPSWEELYKQDVIEKLPWYWPALDPDLEAALARNGLASGRVLDEGTGPGTSRRARGARRHGDRFGRLGRSNRVRSAKGKGARGRGELQDSVH